MLILGLKFLCWVIAIWFTQVNTVKIIRGQDVPRGNFYIQAIAITGLMLLYNIL